MYSVHVTTVTSVVFTCVTLLCYLFILPSLPHPLPSTALIASSTSLPCTNSSVSPISVSTTQPGESCICVCVLYVTWRWLQHLWALNRTLTLFSQVSGPPCQSYFISKYLSKSVLTTPHLGSSFSMTRQAVK